MAQAVLGVDPQIASQYRAPELSVAQALPSWLGHEAFATAPPAVPQVIPPLTAT